MNYINMLRLWVSSDMTLHNLVHSQHLRGTWYLHMQSSSSYSLKMEAASPSEMLVPVYQTTFRAVPEGCDIRISYYRNSDDTLLQKFT